MERGKRLNFLVLFSSNFLSSFDIFFSKQQKFLGCYHAIESIFSENFSPNKNNTNGSHTAHIYSRERVYRFADGKWGRKRGRENFNFIFLDFSKNYDNFSYCLRMNISKISSLTRWKIMKWAVCVCKVCHFKLTRSILTLK